MISIIIPTYQEELVLEKTLKSLRNGFDPLAIPYEIIVSDGKSSDRTLEIAKQWAHKVVVHTGLSKQTIAGGRNAGAKEASGDILIFLDADCTIKDHNLFFKTVAHAFKDRKMTGLTGWLEVLPHHATLADHVISYIVSFVYMVLNNFLFIGASFGELQIIRKESFEKLGGYKEHLAAGEDVDMFQRLSTLGRTKLDSTLVIYHTGRRAHKIGWPRLLFQWFMNTIRMLFTGKSTKEWTAIR